MSAGAVTFTDAIHAYGKKHEIDLTADRVGIIDSVLKSLGRIQGNAVSFDMGDDLVGSFDEIMARETMDQPRIRAPQAEPIPVAAGSNATDRAVAANAALRSTKADAKASMAVDLVAKFGNPWRSGNKTHQAFVQNTNPALATQLRSTEGR